ncbi:MAG: UvrD-helicase domain-containing protein [Clostridia bacterium]|nr:UvrD-helicase domain-containing protein [Clostridia bacterium]
MGILDGLNDRQLEAARHSEGALLVLAGAGSGKTKMLTSRIARLIEEERVAPWNILAVTFTNKAAREMRERLEAMTSGGQYVWCSTFHSLCVRILRREAERIGYKQNFSIYDEEDSGRILKTCLAKAQLSENTYAPKFVRAQISRAKDKMVPPSEFASWYGDDFRAEKLAQIYAMYQNALREAGAMDFDDLILNTLMLFQQNQDVLTAYAARFRYVHVDEYQDTSQAQYMLIRLLSSYYGNICVVGDDDQSIYGWRGADIRNILDFEKDFPGARTIRLEQNYRSTGSILNMANAVIANNPDRKPKKLWTQNPDGDLPILCAFENANDEADFVASEIQRLVQTEGYSYGDIAVFYRTHAQSRLLGQSIVRNSIPYRVHGGVGFWQRKEVKDAMAYLKLLVNPDDAVSVRRIINVPKRGIGDAAVDAIETLAAEREENLLAAVMDFPEAEGVPSRAKKPVARFAELMAELSVLSELLTVSELTEQVILKTELLSMYNPEDEEDAARRENLLELVTAAKQFEAEWEMGVRTYTDEEAESGQIEQRDPTLADWLMSVSLESDVTGDDGETQNPVTLMTIHGAKGLEFPVVFLTGMEEGVFPHSRALEDENQMQEERRLCYVGITRAEKLLYLTRAQFRALNNNAGVRLASRFLKEFPKDAVDERMRVAARSNPFYDDDEGFGNFFSLSDRPSGSSFSGYGARTNSYGTTSRASSYTGTKTSFAAQSAKIMSGAKPAQKQKKEGVPASALTTGDHVRHAVFGSGVVISVKGDLVTVAFDGRGIKQLSAAFAALEKE